MRISLCLLTLLLLFVTACAPTRFVEPLELEHYAVTAALGGPLISYSDLVIPMPLSSVAVGYGYSSSLTVFGALHTSALLFDDAQLEVGVLQNILKQHGWQPAISISPVANLVLALRDGRFKFWPQLDANLYWHYAESSNVVYLGSSNWFELSATRAHGETQERHWIPSIELGHIFNGDNWQYTAELKYLAVGVENTPNVVEYHGLGDRGALGIYLALTRKF